MIGFSLYCYVWSERQEVKYWLCALILKGFLFTKIKYTAKYTALCKSHLAFSSHLAVKSKDNRR